MIQKPILTIFVYSQSFLMDSENKNRKISSINLNYYSDREKELFSYLCFVKSKVDEGVKIPARVLNKIGNIFEEVTPTQYLGQKLIIDTVIKRFNNEDYRFKCSKILFIEDIPNEDGSPNILKLVDNYNIQNLITHIIKETYYNDIYKKIDKDDCIILVYNCLEKYCNENLNKKTNKLLTTYKKQVLAGFITIQYGFCLMEDRTPTNYQLFQATRNAIKKRGKNLS